ncbi:MAG: HAD family hydrolase, partial [Synechococcaceae cyanobacterium]|nr:HAD family hydrolase [Synechococcaceae cyanobacterium]
MAESAAAAPALEALLWDVDGTLADTELDGHRPAFNRAFCEEGLSWYWDEVTYRRLLAVSGGRERIDHWCRSVSGHPADPDLLTRLTAAKASHYAALVRCGGVVARPGVASLIAEAAVAGCQQTIVTTSSRAAVEALMAGALREQAGAFARWICGEDVRCKKPDPEAYRLALAALDP